MASSKLMETKDGRPFYLIRVRQGRGKPCLQKRWYVPDGWSKKAIERELKKVEAEFERACAAGEVLTRADKKKKAAEEAAEAAKPKTVRQYATGVFMREIEVRGAENTRLSYQSNLDNHILPVIGDMLLVEVTPAILHKLLTDFQAKGHKCSSAIKLYNILNGIFNMAFCEDEIPINPLLKVKRPKPRKDEAVKPEDEKYLTARDLSYMLSCVEKEPLKWQAYITLAADTGARRGELCGLQWQDIDWNAGTVRFERNLQYSPQKGVYETTLKNRHNRVVDIGQDTIALLRRLRNAQAESCCISKYVFSQDGTPDPMHPDSPTKYFKTFGKTYDIPDFHPHKLRHTCASLSAQGGAEPKSAADRLGHSEATYFRKYVHSSKESRRRVGQIVRDQIESAKAPGTEADAK